MILPLALIAATPAVPLEDIRGLKPFLSTGPNPWAIALVAIVIAVVAFVFLYLARQKGFEEQAIGLAPSHAPKTIRGRLDALRSSKHLAHGDAARFCDQLSEILRDFLLQRYGLSSRRLTSTELLGELERRRVPSAVYSHIESIFSACDLVKFAKVRLGSSELKQHLTAAYLVLEFAGQASIGTPEGETP